MADGSEVVVPLEFGRFHDAARGTFHLQRALIVPRNGVEAPYVDSVRVELPDEFQAEPGETFCATARDSWCTAAVKTASEPAAVEMRISASSYVLRELSKGRAFTTTVDVQSSQGYAGSIVVILERVSLARVEPRIVRMRQGAWEFSVRFDEDVLPGWRVERVWCKEAEREFEWSDLVGGEVKATCRVKSEAAVPHVQLAYCEIRCENSFPYVLPVVLTADE